MSEINKKSYSEKEKKLIREKYLELCQLIDGKGLYDSPPDGEIIIHLPGGGVYKDPPGICTE